MTINKKNENNIVTFSLAGRLDTITAPDLEASFQEETSKNIVMDFSQLEYISSAGLRVLLKIQKTVQSSGSLIIRNVSDTIKEVLDITGFSEILTIE